MEYIFGDYFTHYMRNPQDVVWSYMEFYFHGLTIGDMENMLIAAPTKVTPLYTVTIPNLMKAFGQSADAGTFIVEKGTGGSLTTKATLDQILYLAFMGYPDVFNKLNETVSQDSNGNFVLNEGGIKNLLIFLEQNNLLEREFAPLNVKPSLVERGKQFVGLGESLKAEASIIPSIPSYLKRINENESIRIESQAGPKVLSESIFGLVYPIFYFTPLSNQDTLEKTLANMGYVVPDINSNHLSDLDCDEINNYFFCELPKIVYYLTTLESGIGDKVSVFFDNIKNEISSWVMSNNKSSASLPEEEIIQSLFNGDSPSSLLSYIRKNRESFGESASPDKTSDSFAKTIKNTVSVAYTLLNQYMENPTFYTSMSKNVPTNNKEIFYQSWLDTFYGELKDSSGSDYILELQKRLNYLLALQDAINNSDSAGLSKEMGMVQELVSFYSELLSSFQIVTNMFASAIGKSEDYGNLANSRLMDISNSYYLNTGINRYSDEKPDKDIYNTARTSDNLPAFIDLFNAGDTWFSNHATADVVAKLITGLLDLFIFVAILMAWFTFFYFFLMRALQCTIFFIVWPVHIFKSLIKGDFQFLKTLLTNWLGFRFYDFVVCMGFMFAMIFIEVIKVMQVEATSRLSSQTMQAIFIKGMLAIFVFLTLQIIRMLYSQIIKIIESKDQMFANSLNRVADSMVASTHTVGALLGAGIGAAKMGVGVLRRRATGGIGGGSTPAEPKGGTGTVGSSTDSIKDTLDSNRPNSSGGGGVE